MDMLDVTDSDIGSLGDAVLRELVGRLVEATLRQRGLTTAAASWGGEQDAADGGLDVAVDLDPGTVIDGFIPRPMTGFQVKRPDLARAAILEEMRPRGRLRPSIATLADAGGAYVLACSGSKLTPTMREHRLAAMAEAVSGHPNAAALRLAFYDRQQLATWVRDHPGLIPWAREKAGRLMQGWRSYGGWSSTGSSNGGAFLSDDGLRLRTGPPLPPGSPTAGSSALDAVAALRTALTSGTRAIRMVGLSGVGKTRLAEALFDEAIGTGALDSTRVIYADLAHGPEPSPLALATQLMHSRMDMTLVIDNCKSDLHRQLVDLCRTAGSAVRILTIEYDIRDDQPEGTDVFHLEAASPALVAKLVRARFPKLSQVDCETIGDFSGGNARIGIALADTVHAGDRLAGLTDESLFLRLFEQRHGHDPGLLSAAEACALVYSFHGDPAGDAPEEMTRIAALAGCASIELHRHVQELKRRGLLQQRGPWRAVLPHAIANRLAIRALENLPYSVIKAQLVDGAPHRILQSLSRRLGYLHDDATAVGFAEAWLAPGGLLGDISKLSEVGIAMLVNVAPAAPEAALAAIERAATYDTTPFVSVENPNRSPICRLLRKLAFDATLFERCAELLARFVLSEPLKHRHDSVAETWRSLFPLYLSGTHAPVDARMRAIDRVLLSGNQRALDLGEAALHSAMQTDYFASPHDWDFGARRRDYGYHPDVFDEVKAWFGEVIRLTTEIGKRRGDSGAAARRVLASNLPGLWMNAEVPDEIEKAAAAFSADGFWEDGWVAVMETLWRCRGAEERFQAARLVALKSRLAPTSLMDRIGVYVLRDRSRWVDAWETPEEYTEAEKKAEGLAEKLGKEAADKPKVLNAILPRLVRNGHGHFQAFARGLAQAASDRVGMWTVIAMETAAAGTEASASAIAGFLSAWFQIEPENTRAALDATIGSPTLGRFFPLLEGSLPFDVHSPRRLHRSLVCGLAPPSAYYLLATKQVVDAFSPEDRLSLAVSLADTPDGWRMAVDILASWFRFACPGDADRSEFRSFGRTLLQRLDPSANEHEGRDHDLATLATACLAGDDGLDAARDVSVRLAATFAKRLVSAYRFHTLLLALFNIQPMVALDAFLLTEAERRRSSPLLAIIEEFGGHHRNPLVEVDDETVLVWCGRNPISNFNAAAACVPFARSGEAGNQLAWTALAEKLILRAPDRRAVLQQFIERFAPMSWTGSRAVIVEKNTELLGIVEHWGDEVLAEFACCEGRRLMEAARLERIAELQRSRASDERFE